MKKQFLLISSCVICAAIFSEAGPSLPITKPPVTPLTLLTGPAIDPAATNGQWFLDYASGTETNRTHEFYDNVVGGGLLGANAITGYVSSITFISGPGTPITAFSIQATIWNDTSVAVEFLDGSDSHGEALSYKELPYVGTMLDVKLTASFAVTDTNNLPLVWPYPPYRDRPQYIEATNEDQAAWYCWSPADEEPLHNPKGNYYVPTWDFGTILQGQSATRQLDFIIQSGGLLPGDTRYAAITNSFGTQTDVLLNRTTSLKISTWIDEISADSGIAYPEDDPYRGSDVSVFHNIVGEETELDFGDAPDPSYPTLLASDGARHVIVAGVQMGPAIDSEPDGQPTTPADGDDTNMVVGVDDEDGVTFASRLLAGRTATVAVVCTTSGYISAWIDYDMNGSWAGSAEQILSAQSVTTGVNWLTFSVPSAAVLGTNYARFRFTTFAGSISYTGLVSDGEVEDYTVLLEKEEEEQLDFGDALDPAFPTLLASTGACHTIVPGVMLGTAEDAETDGQPTPSADGDDNNPVSGTDDEDGIVFPSVFVAGASPVITVTASTAGFLDAWIDWNCNGTWADVGERVFVHAVLVAGTNTLIVPVPLPPAAVAGGPHSRWRFTTNALLVVPYTGWIDHGEVEDYELHVEVLDFGDAPDPSYPTLLTNNGARHRLPSALWLGAQLDCDPDGQPTVSADGDDLANVADEDGVTLTGSLVQGQVTSAAIVASTNGVLDAWLDFNADGDWADSGENIAASVAMLPGTNSLNITVPATAMLGPTFARFRFSSSGGLADTGLATDGEVEDYLFSIYQQGPSADLNVTNVTVIGNRLQFQWNTESAVTYEAQCATGRLDDAGIAWVPFGGYVSDPTNTIIDTNAVEPLKFYRVVAPFSPPPP